MLSQAGNLSVTGAGRFSLTSTGSGSLFLGLNGLELETRNFFLRRRPCFFLSLAGLLRLASQTRDLDFAGLRRFLKFGRGFAKREWWWAQSGANPSLELCEVFSLLSRENIRYWPSLCRLRHYDATESLVMGVEFPK